MTLHPHIHRRGRARRRRPSAGPRPGGGRRRGCSTAVVLAVGARPPRRPRSPCSRGSPRSPSAWSPCPAGRRCPCWSRSARSASPRSGSSGTSRTHIDNGRDAGPFANVAHYPILAGLGGVALAGFLAAVLGADARDRAAIALGARLADPARRRAAAAVRRARDDRLPARRRLAPHLRPGRHALGPDARADDRRRLAGPDRRLAAARRGPLRRAASPSARPRCCCSPGEVQLAGAALVGLSTLQLEFGYGVPQFQLAFHPILIALAGERRRWSPRACGWAAAARWPRPARTCS